MEVGDRQEDRLSPAIINFFRRNGCDAPECSRIVAGIKFTQTIPGMTLGFLWAAQLATCFRRPRPATGAVTPMAGKGAPLPAHIVTRLSAGEAGEFSWAVAGFASIASNMLLRAFIRVMTRLSTLITRETCWTVAGDPSIASRPVEVPGLVIGLRLPSSGRHWYTSSLRQRAVFH